MPWQCSILYVGSLPACCLELKDLNDAGGGVDSSNLNPSANFPVGPESPGSWCRRWTSSISRDHNIPESVLKETCLKKENWDVNSLKMFLQESIPQNQLGILLSLISQRAQVLRSSR